MWWEFLRDAVRVAQALEPLSSLPTELIAYEVKLGLPLEDGESSEHVLTIKFDYNLEAYVIERPV